MCRALMLLLLCIAVASCATPRERSAPSASQRRDNATLEKLEQETPMIKAWIDCVSTGTLAFAATNEPAGTVATAAMGACHTEESALRLLWFGEDHIIRAIDAEKEQLRERMIAAVVAYRAKQRPIKPRPGSADRRLDS